MKYKKLIVSSALSLILFGCGSDDSTPQATPKTEINATVIDGYLKGAKVWLDVNENFEFDVNEPSAVSGEQGKVVLDVTGIESPSAYPIVAQAEKNQTIDESTGSFVTHDFVMSAPKGEMSITPISTLVHLHLQQNINGAETLSEFSSKLSEAKEAVASSLGLNKDDVLGDYVEGGKEDVLYAAENIIASGVLPEVPSALENITNDSTGNTQFDDDLSSVSETIKQLIAYVNLNDDMSFDEQLPRYKTVEQDSECGTGFVEYGVICVVDSDNDAIGNNIDTDDDNDDFPDIRDKYPLDSSQAGPAPEIYLFTDNSNQIQKEQYTYGLVSIGDESNLSDIDNETMKIKGRGNSTWSKPKKPYQLKFDNKSEFLNMPKDKKWIFLAEYNDKSLLRNTLAFEMGYLSSLDYTPQGEFAEVYINNNYQGIYNITQKVEVSDNRLDIGDDGYLLEIDQLHRLDPDDVYFYGDRNYLFNIKEPKLSANDDAYNLIKDQINTFENVLASDDFSDPNVGYRTLIDVDSFVDFYLINEIARTNDIFYSSTYVNFKPNEKIKMGPLWDFDISFGNINYNGNEYSEGFWVKKQAWYARLFQDPYFINKVKERFSYYREKQPLLMRKIDNYARYLDDAQTANYKRWQTLGVYIWPNYVWFDTYQEEVDYLKTWISTRMDWLDNEFSSM
jgi:hypothetical protein